MKKHYLVDTNVIIDMLLDREDADAACAVFDGAERGEYNLHICALSFTTMFYSLRKILSREDRINVLITRNTKDFKDSSLEVIDSIEFLNSK